MKVMITARIIKIIKSKNNVNIYYFRNFFLVHSVALRSAGKISTKKKSAETPTGGLNVNKQTNRQKLSLIKSFLKTEKG
jgi:hypothetical protein